MAETASAGVLRSFALVPLDDVVIIRRSWASRDASWGNVVSHALLLVSALLLGQAADRPEWLLVPQYSQGQELIYKGSCTEESLVPGVQHQRQYALEVMLFLYDTAPKHWDAALVTSLSLANPKFAPTSKAPPGSVRLELVKLDQRGRLIGKNDLSIPLTGLPFVESGAFFELPAVRVNAQSYWEESQEGRPLRSWQVLGPDVRSGIPCLKLLATQQSRDWNEPRADSTAWRRKDLIWFAPQLGLVYRVERIIERREPARQDPTQRTTVAYEVDSKLKFPGKLFEDRKEELLKAGKFLEEAAPLLSNPVQYRGQIDALARRIAFFLDNHAPTPYRKALAHLKTRLEQARNGELPAEQTVEERTPPTPAKIGHKVADFVITDLTSQRSRHFYQFLGQPILLIYYNPASDTGRQVLRFGQTMFDRYGADVTVLGMAVSDDIDQVRKQHEDMGLSFPVLDGRAMHRTFGVDGTPRVVLLDAEAVVRCATTGWGYHIPDEITEEVKKALNPR